MSNQWVKQIVLVWAVMPTVHAGWDSADLDRSEAMNLTPDYQRGKALYGACAVCHMPEGWGTPNGAYPQIAGQHRSVTIKQLADIRAKNRDNPSMYAFAIDDVIGGPQAVSDVAYYIETLRMIDATGKGDGKDLEYGRKLYIQYCTECHGTQGEGSYEQAYPAIYSQHYNYTLRQLDWLQNGKRRNGNKEMIEIINGFEEREFKALSDYISRMPPPADKRSRHSWNNRGLQER